MSFKNILLVPFLAVVLIGCAPDDPAIDTADEAAVRDTVPVDRAGVDTLDVTAPEPSPVTRDDEEELSENSPGAAGPTSPDGPRSGEAGTGREAAAPAGDAAEIMRRVERRYAPVRTLQAEFVQRLNVPLLGSEQVSRGRLYQQQPNLFAMRFTDPAGDVVVADGRHLWMYQPSEDPDQVLRTRLADGSAPLDFHREFLQDAGERFRISREGEATVQGRSTHVLRLVPRSPAGYRQVRIWVDQETNEVHRFEVEEENETVRRIDLRNVRTNESIPRSVFEFTPPEGASVFEP